MTDEPRRDDLPEGAHVKRRRVFNLPHLSVELEEVERPPGAANEAKPSLVARAVPWILGAAFAAVLLVLGIHRNSWTYTAIIVGLVAAAWLVTSVRWRR